MDVPESALPATLFEELRERILDGRHLTGHRLGCRPAYPRGLPHEDSNGAGALDDVIGPDLQDVQDPVANASAGDEAVLVLLEQLAVEVLEQRHVQAVLVAEVVDHRRALDA